MIPYLKVFGYLIPTIAAVVGASVQGIAQPLKETHRVSLLVFLSAIIVHYIAFAADEMSQRNQANPSQLWGFIAIISGSLSTVSLVSILFTHSVAEIICYIALGCAAVIIVVYQYGSRHIRFMYKDINLLTNVIHFSLQSSPLNGEDDVLNLRVWLFQLAY
ncbi:hypothetical protein WN944_005933 [Citrus x changshan-huyou]|uniref:Uncharacterized protein n=1 Tax=Citrus x changshan-huyou TaxID=2935761 RepID=A0AAP0QWQ2_9ROSI